MKATRDRILPAYPKTVFLPHKPNITKDDVVASDSEAKVIFDAGYLNIEEKVDGASVGITILDDHPIIRSHDRLIAKGSARGQFANIYGWFYQHRKMFKQVTDLGTFSIYGEWMVRAHGIHYSRLPDWLIAYDIYNYHTGSFLAPTTARRILQDAGFVVPMLRFQGKFEGTYDDLEAMANLPAAWADDKAEGIYIKVCDHDIMTHRFKMVRADFQRGMFWEQDVKNGIHRTTTA